MTDSVEYIENRTFEEIKIGDAASLSRTLKNEDIQSFAIMSGDISPTHLDPEYAKSFAFREIIAHGMWPGVLITTVLGTELPGPGTILIDQNIHFSRPVRLGDTVTVTVTVQQKFEHNHHISFDCRCVNQEGAEILSGTAEVTIGDKTVELHENQSTYIPIGEVHRLANPGKVPLEVIEVQVGSYTGEDDIVRLEDVYGRG